MTKREISNSLWKELGVALKVLVFLFFFFFLSFFLFAPVAYGGSQARGLIGAVAPDLCQSCSTTRSKLRLRPTPSSWQHRVLNPLSEARDRTCNLMVPSWIR